MIPGNLSVALVAEPEASDRFVGAAGVEQLSVSSFDSVEELLAAEPGPTALAVLWTDEEVATVATRIGPLREALGGAAAVMIRPEIRAWELRAALAAGVAGVVLEGELADALAPCLRAAHAGQICVPSEHREQVRPPSLSSREKQILGLVVMGQTNAQIAERLFLAESTVKSHLSSSFGKLGVRSRNEAVDLILDPERGFGMGILALGDDLPAPGQEQAMVRSL